MHILLERVLKWPNPYVFSLYLVLGNNQSELGMGNYSIIVFIRIEATPRIVATLE